VALFNALTSGRKEIVAVAVVAGAPGGPMPCGACRQLLAEYAPQAMIYVADSRALNFIREFRSGNFAGGLRFIARDSG